MPVVDVIADVVVVVVAVLPGAVVVAVPVVAALPDPVVVVPVVAALPGPVVVVPAVVALPDPVVVDPVIVGAVAVSVVPDAVPVDVSDCVSVVEVVSFAPAGSAGPSAATTAGATHPTAKTSSRSPVEKNPSREKPRFLRSRNQPSIKPLMRSHVYV